jgi:hypothetical protein
MQNTINAVASKFLLSEVGKGVVDDFYRMQKDPGWKFMQMFVAELGNHISNETLSRRFQKLDNEEKLIQLAAYSKVSTLLKFFLNPVARFEALAKRKQHSSQMGAPVKKAFQRMRQAVTRKE